MRGRALPLRSNHRARLWAILLVLGLVLPLLGILGRTVASGPPSVDAITTSPDATSPDTPATVNQAISFTVNVSGDPSASLALTMYWNYTDLKGGGEPSNNQTATVALDGTGHGSLTVAHAYPRIGPLDSGNPDVGGYVVRVDASDGTNTGSGYIFVYVQKVLGNRAPYFSAALPSSLSVTARPPNYSFPVNLGVSILDPDNDALTVTWNWGDGSVDVNRTGPAGTGVTVRAYHVYQRNFSFTPNYAYWNATATLDDGHNHTVVGGPTLVVAYEYADGGPVVRSVSWDPTIPGTNDVYNGAAINFTVDAYDPEGDALKISWDFNGDGAIDALGSAASWIFPGDQNLTAHVVTVHVSDGEWKKPTAVHNTSYSVQVYSLDNRPPVAPPLPSNCYLADGTTPALCGVQGVPMVIHYLAADEDGDPLSFRWDFGDGTTETLGGIPTDPTWRDQEVFANHTYTSTGTFTLTVQVTDGLHPPVVATGYALITTTGTVDQPPVIMDFHTEVNGVRTNRVVVGQWIAFHLTVSDPDDSQLRGSIDLGDGNPHNFTLPANLNDGVLQAIYYRAGNYTVVLQLSDYHTTVQANLTIQVIIPAFHFSIGRPVELGSVAGVDVLIPVHVHIDAPVANGYAVPVQIYFEGRPYEVEHLYVEGYVTDADLLLYFPVNQVGNYSVDVVWGGNHTLAGPWYLPDYSISTSVQSSQILLGDPLVLTATVKGDNFLYFIGRLDYILTVDGVTSEESHTVTLGNGSLAEELCIFGCNPFNLPPRNPNGPTFHDSWRIPLVRGTHTITLVVRDGTFGHTVTRATFTVNVVNQFGPKTKALQASLDDASQDLASLSSAFSPLGIDVGPLMGRLKAIRDDAMGTLAQILPLGSVASDVAKEFTDIALRADDMATQAQALAGTKASTAQGLWGSVAAVALGIGLLATKRRKRRAP